MSNRKHNTRHARLAAAVVAAAAVGSSGAAVSDTWPSRAVTMVVPFAPGGLADIVARPLAANLEKQLKQPFIVVNRPGAAGAIGIQSVAKAQTDGYTLLVTLASISSLPALADATGKPTSFKREEFSAIARLAADPCLIFVQSDAPWKTVKDLVDDAKRRPDDIIYSSSGVNGPTHLPTEMLQMATGTKMRHVPTGGGGPAMQMLLGRNVQFFFTVPALGMEHVSAGTLRVLASSSASRLPELPNIPTLKEAGIDVEYLVWAGLFAQKEVPAGIRATIGKAVAKSAADREFVEGLRKTGTALAYQGPEEFQAWWDQDSVRLSNIIKAINKNE